MSADDTPRVARSGVLALFFSALAMPFAPRPRWQALIAQPRTSWTTLAALAVLLAALPAFGWAFGLYLGTPNPWIDAAAVRGSPVRVAASAAATFAGALGVIALFALALWLIAPMYRARRDAGRAALVATVAAALPLAVGLALALPALMLAVLVAMLPALAVAWQGVQVALGVPEDEAAECIAIAATLVALLALAAGGVAAMR